MTGNPHYFILQTMFIAEYLCIEEVPLLCSGGSSIEALEAVLHQLLGKKAFIGLLPLFHSCLRLHICIASMPLGITMLPPSMLTMLHM